MGLIDGLKTADILLRGMLIATTRLLLLWVGVSLLGQFADSRQVIGYGLTFVSGIVELSVASVFSGNERAGLVVASVLIVVTSFALAWLWTTRAKHASTR